VNYRRVVPLVVAAAALLARPARAQPDPQPFLADARRVVEAMDFLGSPLAPADEAAAASAFRDPNPSQAAAQIARILDRYCLFDVTISPEQRVGVSRGPAEPVLAAGGWRQFLVKVTNLAGATGQLVATSPNARSVFGGVQRTRYDTSSDRAYSAAGSASATPIYDRWLDLQMYDAAPLQPKLSGLEVEYRIVQLYSRDAGRREATIAFDAGQGTQEIGFGNDAAVLFRCEPARSVRLHLLDENGRPATVSLLIRDRAGRVCPSQAKRLAPDFAFQPQIYRKDGEVLQLQDGDYTVRFSRGPESIPQTDVLRVDAAHTEWSCRVRRWIDAAALGWWSGDHHIHAAGCAHYCEPSQGVLPSDMAVQCLGEDLKVGGVLTYGPCFDYQKQFFSPVRDAFSRPPYLLHYDIEVSGFGSQRSGHLCLLGLKDQLYPGCASDENWPTTCLKILRWAKAQGAVTGTAHSGWGLQPAVPDDHTVPVSTSSADIRVQTDALPNWIVPPYNGIGANEYVVDVTQEVPGPDGKPVPAVDFYSAVDTPAVWELNLWYHALNCGFRTRLAGETDFPCIYMDRVGMGRSYVKLPGEPTYRAWIDGLRAGRSYVGDGKSHLMNFTVGGVAVGEKGSELDLAAPGTVHVAADVAAWLPPAPNPALQHLSDQAEPYWDLERARLGASREVPVEVVVNGEPVARRVVVADGKLRPLAFDVDITRSSWVALRILYSSHSNPVFVVVGGRPIRASRASAEWCLQGVERCWSQKERFIRTSERAEARAAYDSAAAVYRRIAAESDDTPDVATAPTLP
jgi:hypothetical protein